MCQDATTSNAIIAMLDDDEAFVALAEAEAAAILRRDQEDGEKLGAGIALAVLACAGIGLSGIGLRGGLSGIGLSGIGLIWIALRGTRARSMDRIGSVSVYTRAVRVARCLQIESSVSVP